ncbi:MAG: histidine kinase [Candidatus Villigracilaceae bacterium]
MNNTHIQELEEKIAELKKRWPAHSVPPALMQELDELEEQLTEALEQARQEEDHA